MPGEWRHKTIGELTDNFDNVRVPVAEIERRKGEYPYYGASGIVDHVDEYLFDGEYLLIAEDGENLRTRKTPIAFVARGRFWVNNHAHIVRANHDADTRFLMFALSASEISGYLTGSTMPKLTQGNLNRIPIFAPPVEEQRAIARILGAFDDKIELNRRMSETLEAMARALFKSWFIDFDPVSAKAEARKTGLPQQIADLFPKSFKDSPLGKIPETWRIVRMGDVADIVGGSTPRTDVAAYWSGGVHAWVTPKDLSRLTVPVLLETERKITDDGLGQIGSGLLPPGTVLLSSRAPIGYLAVSEIPVAINQGFIAMKSRHGISNLYLLQWAAAAHDEIISRANGSTFLEISKSNFRSIPVSTPPKPIMDAFDRQARPIFRRIVEAVRDSETLAALRDALLPKLISGEIRVKDAESLVETAA